ncbi:hypothetical protein BHE74_00045984 [Ensete ventricosum]|nr:hypothetical protein BHE74_00045984 [Ensete ventricosum]
MGGTYRSDMIPVREPLATGRRRTRRCLVFPRGDEAIPRLPARGRGVASSSCAGTWRRLVFQRENVSSFSLEARLVRRCSSVFFF